MTQERDRAIGGYGAGTGIARAPRDAERAAFARVTRALTAAAEGPVPALAAAVHDNRRLWTALATDAAGAANGLPADLRSRIVWLAAFVQREGAAVLRRERGPEGLITVNRAVLEGLSPAAAPAAA
ncbi:flagellar protein FlaF [Hasllibacter halocynthiae]|uniref:Flagellar protein FlaF n=1 Tax=Hasllibacter halocynthiae TaxID=595589 RepID=A0A2T0X2N6_9RHOB|nr:flagellar biosynthesis regulator FlaF [Hasllibacter halocynthiae]PRY93219.1 flagellar protein FlaF [Hasllibacter halocynthiae]